MRKLLTMTVLAFALGGVNGTLTAQAKKWTQFERQQMAVISAFCERHVDLTNPCEYGREALVVAANESGARHWPFGRCYDAKNGQYLGCFQMGDSERATYGNGTGFWEQAKAAFRYFVASGKDWSPWSCKPSGYCYS